MAMIPDDLQYTDNHEWIRLDGESAFVGITDHLQAKMGPVSRVRLPAQGDLLRCGDETAALQSDSTTHSMSAPVSGTVNEVNPKVANNPGIVNADPYGEGWLFKLRIEAGEEIEHLLDPETYRRQLEASDRDAMEVP